jgi:hypothetical protein
MKLIIVHFLISSLLNPYTIISTLFQALPIHFFPWNGKPSSTHTYKTDKIIIFNFYLTK